MKVSTINEWNLHAACAGCCPLPECPAPAMLCESLMGTWGCGDTDYSKAREKWEAERDKWMDEESGRDASDYPIPPPEKPEDYDDYDYGCWGQFTDPELDPDEEMPTLYTRLKETAERTEFKGFHEYYLGTGYASGWLFGRSRQTWSSADWTADVVREEIQTGGGFADAPPPWNTYPCTLTSSSINNADFRYAVDDEDAEYVVFTALPTPPPACSETNLTFTAELHRSTQSGTVPLVACPNPEYAYAEFGFRSNHDIYRRRAESRDISSPLTKETLTFKAAGEIPEEWPEEPEGGSCVAALYVAWPTYQDMLVDDESGPGKHYPACAEGPAETEAGATATKVRYKMCIPESWQDDSGSGSGDFHGYFAVQWDEVFFPKDADGSGSGSGAEPVLIASRAWEWTGDMDETCSDWYEMDAPTEEGEVRVVNVLTKCFKTSRIGSLPTAHGEFVDV